MLRSATPPSINWPTPSGVSSVDAALTVTAAKAAIGGMRIRCTARLPTNGMESDRQFGLKSVAIDHFHPSLIHCSIALVIGFPCTYGVPGRNPVLTPASDAFARASSDEYPA